ncbi:trithorax group protein osa [Drosophila subpulchrella]|uniref:trithorax group protein osa n=1 Tax=Drosophila subpulchrella TaxID=1486046 RepID=UPI0018A150A8|nr:trithorax group protein osa [Drosophila subpulchrella]
MICKQDVLLWFEKLESYHRIETMYALLTACLPFELRFLGTLLEEQGRCDSETLRGMELRANNPHELAADMVNCQKGDPTDRKIRRKMALYLALIRACNRNCVSEIYRTLECWGECDFGCINDQDTLLELLLVYTMAAIHPVFSMEEQKKIFGILAKIKENKLVSERFVPQMQAQTQTPAPQHPHPPSPHDLILQQPPHVIHQMTGPQPPPPHPQHHQMVQMLQTPQGNIPLIFPQHFPKILNSSDGTHQISVDGMTHQMCMQPNITIPGDTSAIIGHQQTGWTMRHYVPQPPHQQPALQQPQSLDNQVPPASSPMLSQQSSPSSSRTTSPQRDRSLINVPLQAQHQQQQPMRSMSQRLAGQKNARRPSAETTPPPTSIGGEQQHESINDGGSSNSSGTSLHSIIRNGFPRPGHHHRVKANTFIPQHQQQQHFQNPNYNMNVMMQSMNLTDDGSGSMMGINSTKSAATTGSESGSSNGSCGDLSPSETPTPTQLSLPLHSSVDAGMGMITTVLPTGLGGYQPKQHHLSYKQQQQLNLHQRLNGRNGMDKSYQQVYTTGTQSIVSDAQTISSGSLQQQQQLISQSPVTTPTSTVLLQPQQPPPTAYNTSYPYHQRIPPPPQQIFQAHSAPPPQTVRGGYRYPMVPQHNGELIYPAFPTSLTFLPMTAGGTPTAVTPPQLQNPAAVVSTNALTVQTVPTPQQQQVPSTTPYSALTVCPITGAGGGGNGQKVISCYNCGSQTHSGRECQEASMEDVTRSASYKLDYSETSMDTNSTGDHHKDVGGMQINSATTAGTVASTGK